MHQLDDSEASLVDGLREGDTAALAALFDRHVDAIFAFCFRRTACRQTAEDLTSAVFLEFWHARSRVQAPDGSVLPWLYGIARNVCRNSERSSRRLARALPRLARRDAASEPDPAEDVSSRLDSEQRMAAVLRAVAGLPDRERDVIELVAWAGLDYEKAATALDIPVGTVKSRLSRARARLSETVGYGDCD